MSGVTMLLMGRLRMGALAKLLSNPVVNGFTIASSVIIAASQIGPLIGVRTSGQTIYTIGRSLTEHVGVLNPWTGALGVSATVFLFWVRIGFRPLLLKLGLNAHSAALVAKTGPVMAIAATTLAVVTASPTAKGVATVGVIPIGRPPFTPPPGTGPLWTQMREAIAESGGSHTPAIEDDRVSGDPFAKVKKLKPPHGAGEPHPIWEDVEVEAVIEGAIARKRPGLARAIALGRWGGFRRGTICTIPRSARVESVDEDNGKHRRLYWITEKRRVLCDKREDPRLTALIARTANSQKTSPFLVKRHRFQARRLKV